LVLLAFITQPTAAHGQSLADLSRQVREERKASTCRVWTNDHIADLPANPSLSEAETKKTIRPCDGRPTTQTNGLAWHLPSATPHLLTTETADYTHREYEPALKPPPSQLPYEIPEAEESDDFASTDVALQGAAPGNEVRSVRTRWRTYNLEGQPQLTYRIHDPYHQNILKADYPIKGDWFLEMTALNTIVHKSRRNLDFSRVFPNQDFISHNSFYSENLIFGAEFRQHDDTFVPSNFRLQINGVADFRHNINAFSDSSDGNAHLFNAFADVRLMDLGHDNFDLMFLRAGIQGFKSDFHGLVFNDVGLGGRIFGEAKKNRLRYDFAYFKLFQKNPVSGFIDFGRPSSHQVAIARLTWEDFLVPGWNSEWTFHYNNDHRKIVASSNRAGLDTFYFGASFNGHIGRWVFNPAFFIVTGHADQLEAGGPAQHYVLAWTGLLDVQYPLDFWNLRFGYMYASGDSNPADRRDTGFDAISDGVVLFGGPLSYWVGENIKFGPGDFVRANSLFPSFRGVNAAANYINPGMHIFNGGVDAILSPRWQTSVNVSYLRFAETGSYTNRVVILDHDGAVETNVFVRWKPFLSQLNENIVFDTGFSVLFPLQGVRGAFQSDRTVFSTFTAFRFIF
jgi:hypothetical protein